MRMTAFRITSVGSFSSWSFKLLFFRWPMYLWTLFKVRILWKGKYPELTYHAQFWCVPSVPVVELVSQFSSCNTYVFCIKHNAHISIFPIWCICRFIFALKYSWYLRCQPPKDLVHGQLVDDRLSNTFMNLVGSLQKNIRLQDTRGRKYQPGLLHQILATANPLNWSSSVQPVLSR